MLCVLYTLWQACQYRISQRTRWSPRRPRLFPSFAPLAFLARHLTASRWSPPLSHLAMDLSAGGLAPSSSRRTPGHARFASPTARPEVSYTISDTRTETVSTTRTVHLATPPKSQQSGSGKKGKGFALPQGRPLTARVSPLQAQEKVFDSPEGEARIVELSGSESEEEMPPPRRSLAGRETGVAKTPPAVESRLARDARRASPAGPSGESGRTVGNEAGQNGHTMSSPGRAGGSSDTETNTPTPPSGRDAPSGDEQHDQLHSSSPGPSQPGDGAALARPPPSQKRTKGHAQEREPHSDEGYATSSSGPSSDPFVNQSDEIEFRDISFDDDFSQTQDTQDTQEVSKRPLEAINEESEGDHSGRESKKARRSQSPEVRSLSHRFFYSLANADVQVTGARDAVFVASRVRGAPSRLAPLHPPALAERRVSRHRGR